MPASCAWKPTPNIIEIANITQSMRALQFDDLARFYAFSTDHSLDFWAYVINKLGIVFKKPYETICDLSNGISTPVWLIGATLNIVDSCFNASPNTTAILYQNEKQHIKTMSYAELNALSNQVANGLIKRGFQAGDAIAIIMPMSVSAVAAYLGIIKMGGVVVGIAESFSAKEIQQRLLIANAKAVFTQQDISWGDKHIPLYTRLHAIRLPCIVASLTEKSAVKLQDGDCHWLDFLSTNTTFESVACDPMSPCNILFSSGTTGTPKAIPWNHTTPIKAASDGYFHQNIQTNDVVCWPTSLGWMMGPWLIFATLINRATIALFSGAPKDRAFGEFIQQAKVTIQGVVPTLVSAWRQSKCMEGLDWQTIKTFTSTAECSNGDDMAYLMSLAGNKPVIEYCGGTEIGGGYLSSTVIQANYPSQFSTPTMGTKITIIDETGQPTNVGEVAIIPPAMGLSTTLLNANHHEVYFQGMPIIDGLQLRRHGDQIERLPNGYYAILGRVDDTMKLGGIKISSAEIERAIAGIPGIMETAAVGIKPERKGPDELFIFAVTNDALNKNDILHEMHQRIHSKLNPLFKIKDIVFVNELPKTASNKIMRRILRQKIMLSN